MNKIILTRQLSLIVSIFFLCHCILTANHLPHPLLKEHLNNISFEENCGQINEEVYYSARSAQAQYFFTQQGVRIKVEDATQSMGLVWDMNFKNANPTTQIVGKKFRKNITNYISTTTQYSNLSNYSEVWYENIYDHIDLRFYSKGDGTIEYDFIIKEGGCTEDITIEFEGIDDFYTDKNGELVLKTPIGTLKKSAPYTYQIIDNQEVEVKSFYKKIGKEIKFEVENYNNNSTLVIDPTTLLMSTYLGGLNRFPSIGAMKVMPDGIYLAGRLNANDPSPSFDYPITAGAYLITANYVDDNSVGFVSKLSLDGKELLFSTYFYNDPVESSCFIHGIDVDATGVYFVGNSTSIPTTAGVIQPNSPNDQFRQTGFITKMNLTGTDLIYSTYLPGRGQSSVGAIKVINQKAYLGGGTTSANFPTTSGAYRETNNGHSEIIAILNEDATAFDYATYIKTYEGAVPSQFASVQTTVRDIEVDAAGNIYAIGKTRYGGHPFTPDALQTEVANPLSPIQPYLLKLNPQGNGTSDLIYSTYTGGDNTANNLDIALHGNDLYGMISNYVPEHDDRWAPSANAYGSSHTLELSIDKNDFIFKFSANTMTLEESTYLNFVNYAATGIDVAEDCGDLYILGYIGPPNDPIFPDAYQASLNGNTDILLVNMSSELSKVNNATYIGGSDNDQGVHIEYHNGAVYFNGATSSTNYPTTTDAYQDNLVGTEGNDFIISAFSTLRAEADELITICPDDNPTLLGEACGGTGNYTYQWSPTTGLNNPNIAQPTLDANQLPIGNTLFTLYVTDDLGAYSKDTVTVQVLGNNIVAQAGSDRYLCANEQAQIGSHHYDIASVTYSWSPSTGLDNPNIGTPITSPTVSTTYTLTYTHCNGTISTDEVFIGIDVDPTTLINTGSDPQPCIGGNMTLGTPELENFIYSWEPTDGMDDPTKAQPYIDFVFKEETYTLTMTNICTGAKATQELSVSLNADGANAGEDAVSCPDVDFTIGNAANPNYTSYQWAFVDGSITGTITNPNTANPTVNVSTAGSHEITLTTNSTACGTSTDTMLVVIIDDTPIPNAGPDQDLCVNYPTNINTYAPVQIGTPGDEAFTYAWSPTTGLDDPTLAEPTVTISQTTTYTLTVTGVCTGNQATDQITLTVPNNAPLAEAYEDDGINDGPDQTLICEQPWGGDYIGMDGRVGVIYSWSPQTRLFEYMLDYEGLDAPSVIAKPYVNTTYYLTAQDTCSGLISRDTILVIVDGTLCVPPDPNDPASAPVADAGDEEVIICEGEDLKIGTPANPNPALTYEWFPTTDLDNPNIPEPTVVSPTNDRSYTLTVTNINTGAKARDIITVRVRPAPLASAGPSPLTFDCGADISNVQLGPANGDTQFENSGWDITWSPTIGLSDPKALRPILNGPDVADAYSVTVVDKITGCSSTAFMTIQFNENLADAGDNKTICPGESVQIGTPGQSGSFNNPIFISYSYQWSPSESLNQFNAAQPIASPTETTEYLLIVTKQTSNFSTGESEICQNSSTVTVTVVETTTEIANAGTDHLGLCPADPDVTIGANTNESPNASYQWSPTDFLSDATNPTPTIDVSALAAGDNTYTLVLTDVNTGCTSSDEVIINIHSTTPPTASVDPTATGCEGEPVDITGVTYPDDYQISWTSVDDPNLDFFGPANSDAPIAFVQSTPMTYTLNVSDQCGGGTATADVTVSTVTAPNIDAMGTYDMVCPGGSLALNGVNTTGATSFSWEPVALVDNATIEQPNFIGSESTILTLTVSNGGCEVSDKIEIIVDTPLADAGEDINHCTGTPVTIGTSGDEVNYDYTWSIISGPGPLPTIINTPQIDVDPTGTTEYQVSVVHKTTGCPALQDSVIVNIPAGTPVANAGTDVNKCPSDAPVQIGTTAIMGVEYQWSPVAGLNNATIATPKASPSITTTYTLRATNICNGTFTEDQVIVTINPVPNADAGEDIEGCEQDIYTLGGTDEGHTYTWSPNLYLDDATIANPTLTLPDNGSTGASKIIYTLTVDDGNGCSATDEVEVTIHPVPELNYADAILCKNSGGVVLGDANSISGYNGIYSVFWFPEDGLDDPTLVNPTANPKGDITYAVSIFTEDGCVNFQEVNVTVEDYTPYPEAGSSCAGSNGYVTVNELKGATYAWTGPNGFSSTSRSNDLTNLTANDFGTYTVTVTSKNGCVYTENAEMVNFCTAADVCDLVIDNFTVSNCIYNDAAQRSEAVIDVTVSWGAGAPAGERIRVTAGTDEVFIDVPNTTSPQTVQVTVPADGADGGLAAEFEFSTSCVAVETYTAPNPCNCTLEASIFADNCMDNGGNNFTARWNLNIEVNEIPDDQISYQRNSEAIQSYTIVGNAGTIQIPNIPADGGAYDTLRVYLTNDVSCGDTIIIKRPAPCPSPLAFCEVVNNGSFESGNYPGAGTPTAFAGGTYVGFSDQTPDLWQKATTNGDNYWVESTAAYNGNKYVYAFSDGTTTGGDDACSQYDLSGLSGNTCYQICIQAADANADGNSSGIAIEVLESTGSFHYQNFELPDNTAWSNNALTTIPWQQYCYNFTTQAGTTGGTIWISASTEVGTASTSYIVVDDVSVCTCGGDEITSGDICSKVSNTEIGGTVWEDWDYNGAMDEDNLIGTQGVQVNLFDDCGNVTQTTYTDSNGNYLFTGLTAGTAYRVEFDLPESVSCWAKPTRAGTDNGTATQFVQSGNCAHLGVANPSEFCQDSVNVITSCFINGDTENTNDPVDAMVQFNYYSTGRGNDATPSAPIFIEDKKTLGSIHGLAYLNTHQTIYSTPFLKRHSGLNEDNPQTGTPLNNPLAAVYKTNLQTGNTELLIDLSTVAGNNFGAVPSNTARGLSSDPNAPSTDSLAYTLIGKVGIGDIDLSDDGSKLYAVNMFDKSLIEIQLNIDGSAGTVQTYKIPDPNCIGGTFRPFGLKYYRGKVYVGVVCDASSSGLVNDLSATIYEWNGTDFLETIAIPLNYTKNYFTPNSDCDATSWLGWIDHFPAPCQIDNDFKYIYPQPLLSDIEFDVDGSMILGFMDRFGHQMGFGNADLIEPAEADHRILSASGDIIRICKTDTGFVLEGENGCNANFIADGGTEYYQDDLVHDEATLGALLLVNSYGQVMTTVTDPITVTSGGVIRLDNTSGDTTNLGYEIYFGLNQASGFFPGGYAGKSNGLGDLEALCKPAPIEIGNYVWEDTDGDGIQDACETGIDNVTITLIKDGVPIASTQTTNGGQYYFSDKNANDPNLNWLGTNADTSLIANTSYIIRISNATGGSQQTALANLNLTITDANNNDSNQIDNDATLNSNHADIVVTTGDYGCMDHSLDFGFQPACEINTTFNQSTCNDNNTPSVETDDYITFTLEVSNTYAGASNQFEIVYNGSVINEGTYGTTKNLDFSDAGQTTRFAADGSTYTFTIRDKDNNLCLEEVTSIPVTECSDCPIQTCLPVLISKNLGQ